MKAIRIHRFGGPEVLQLDELDKPSTDGGKLLIRVAAASVIRSTTRSAGAAIRG